jgi:hypothetical protein
MPAGQRGGTEPVPVNGQATIIEAPSSSASSAAIRSANLPGDRSHTNSLASKVNSPSDRARAWPCHRCAATLAALGQSPPHTP